MKHFVTDSCVKKKITHLLTKICLACLFTGNMFFVICYKQVQHKTKLVMKCSVFVWEGLMLGERAD